MPINLLIQDIVENRISLEQALNKLYLLANNINDSELISWVLLELKGYPEDQDVPEYRQGCFKHFTYSGINGSYKVNNIVFPTEWIPSEYRQRIFNVASREGIKSIEQYSKKEGGLVADRSFLAGYVNAASDELVSCTSIYQHIPQAYYIGICQEVQTRILQALMSIEKKYGQLENMEGVRPMNNKRVFIVHGHNIQVRDNVELLLRRVGLDPIILANEPNKGRTVIDKIEDYSDVSFAIIIYTACDEGRLKGESNWKDRARQNVLFEHGYFCAKLTRAKVVALHERGVEVPSDLSGVLYISLEDDWKAELKREMAAAGLDADWTKF